MTGHKNRKNRRTPNYSFLVSYDPKEVTVNRESNLVTNASPLKLSASKKADFQAKIDSMLRIKKDIIKSLILVSFVLIVEVVVYLGRSYIKLP